MSGSWLVISGLDWIRGSGRVGGEGLERRQDGGLSGLGVKPCHLGRLELHLGKSLLDVVFLLDLFLWYFCLFFLFFRFWTFGQRSISLIWTFGLLSISFIWTFGQRSISFIWTFGLLSISFWTFGHARFFSSGHFDFGYAWFHFYPLIGHFAYDSLFSSGQFGYDSFLCILGQSACDRFIMYIYL